MMFFPKCQNLIKNIIIGSSHSTNVTNPLPIPLADFDASHYVINALICHC